LTTEIPFHDFGGRGPLILFAHANGFPPRAYRHFALPLLPRHRVWGITQRPFRPEARTADLPDWHPLGDDVLRLLDDRGIREVIGVGHSLGGVAMLYAASLRPELFRALVLIEPVFLPPAFIAGLRRDPGWAAEHLPLTRTALGRRRRFPDRAAAFAHWRPKPVFARVPDEVLRDHVDAALREAADGSGELELACPPEWEAHIYATPPTDVWDMVPRIAPPTLGLRGADTDTITPEAWALWQRLQPGATFVEMPELGHLLPLEAPEAVAGVVGEWLAGV
jgi:pimeloyl-ACP methyl ester carboxylesterase